MAAYSSSQSICPASDDALFHFDCPSQFRLITAVSTKSSASGRRSSAWAAGSMPLLSNATSGGRSSIGGGDDVGLPSISGVADPLSIELDEWFTHRHERHFLAATQPTAEASPESGILWSDAIIEDSEIKGRGLSSSPVRRSSYRLSASPMSPLSPVVQPSTSDVHSTSHKRKQANASDSSSNSSSSHIKRAKVGSSEIGANRNISTTNRANNTGASSGNNSRFNTNTTTASISSTSTSTIKKGGSNLSRSGSFATKPALQINTKSNSKSSSSSSSSSTSSSLSSSKASGTASSKSNITSTSTANKTASQPSTAAQSQSLNPKLKTSGFLFEQQQSGTVDLLELLGKYQEKKAREKALEKERAKERAK